MQRWDIEDVIFSPGYFNDSKGIKKIVYAREPKESPGEFYEVVYVHYNKWWKFRDKITLPSKEKAQKFIIELQEIMNNPDNNLNALKKAAGL